MTMALDAVLAYLHYISIFTLFAFLTTQAMLLRQVLDAPLIRLVGRVDLWYFGSAIAALATGFLRAGLGAKGGDFYFGSWPIYLKIALYFVVAILSVYPTLAFVRWRRALEHDAHWRPPASEQARYRKLVMVQLHVAALIPAVAVIMARGLGR
jgi:putative membrane protein